MTAIETTVMSAPIITEESTTETQIVAEMTSTFATETKAEMDARLSKELWDLAARVREQLGPGLTELRWSS